MSTLSSNGHDNEILNSYLSPFANSCQTCTFLTFYQFNRNADLPLGGEKSPCSTFVRYSRLEFLSLALKCGTVLKSYTVSKLSKVAHYFSNNSPADFALRLASTFLGATPVTINWQGDRPIKVAYKIRITNSKLLIIDNLVDLEVVSEVLEILGEEYDLKVCNIDQELLKDEARFWETKEMDVASFETTTTKSDSKIVIFT